jgi:hypothetical protein
MTVVVIVRENRQVDGKESGGAERQEKSRHVSYLQCY